MKRILAALAGVLLCAVALLAGTSCGTPDLSYEGQKAAYDGIIAEYTALLKAKQNGEILTPPDTAGMSEGEAAIAEAVFETASACENPEKMAYTYKDMDGNGTLELLFLTSPMDLQAIFALDGQTPVLLACTDKDKDESWYYDAEGRVYSTVHTILDMEKKQIEATGIHFHVEGAELVQDVQYVLTWFVVNNRPTSTEYFEVVDGTRQPIDESRYNELSADYNRVHDYSGFQSIQRKLNAPRMIFLLDEQTETPPTVDFSTYEAIRETYKAISTRLEDYDTDAWLAGKYDNLFTYPDDVAYSYYQHLLYAAYRGGTCEGYDEIDLNGDGTDELVILNEDYAIKAIFTQKNGMPVLLGAFGYETCWLDGQGLIHIDRNDGYELEYSVYELTKEGDYNTVYSILMTEDGNRYLVKDGEKKQITFEESLDRLYNEYYPYTEPFTANEHTRLASDLTYTPLTASDEDPVKVAVTKSWNKHANLDKTSGEPYGAFSNAYLTFDAVTDTQMTLQIRYAYTVFFPDPEREDYMLDETYNFGWDITTRAENGVFAFDVSGEIKGHLEFGNTCLWLVIEESSNEWFPVGYHCYEVYTPGK